MRKIRKLVKDMPEEHVVTVKVTRYYMFPKDQFTKEMIEDIFTSYKLNQSHASRDYHRIGYKLNKFKIRGRRK